jgi:hemerythrin-like domain-containing protein
MAMSPPTTATISGRCSNNPGFLTAIKTPACEADYIIPAMNTMVMNASIEAMMNEHQLIVQVLASLNALVDKLAARQTVAREDIAKFARFFTQFADKCHHGKEEDRLFVKMNQHGFPKEYGPISVMLAEHDAGRNHLRALAAIGQLAGALSAAEIAQVIEHGREFVPLLASHIQKENNILYPMALQAIPPDEFSQLDAACAAFDREVMPPGEIQRLKDLAAELIAAYPAEPLAC